MTQQEFLNLFKSTLFPEKTRQRVSFGKHANRADAIKAYKDDLISKLKGTEKFELQISTPGYDGKFDPNEFIRAIFYSSVFMNPANGLVTMRDGVESSKFYAKAQPNARWKAYECQKTPAGNFNIDQFELSVCEIEAYDEMCFNDLTGTRLEELIPMTGFIDPEFPPSLEELIIEEVGRQLASDLEVMLFQGQYTDAGSLSLSYPNDQCVKGIYYRLDEAGTFIDVPIGTITESNIGDVLKAMKSARFQTSNFGALDTASLMYVLSPEDFNLYESFLATASGDANFRVNTQPDAMNYQGITVIKSHGVLKDNPLLTFKSHQVTNYSNFWVGTHLPSDFTNVKLDRKNNHDDLMFYKMQTKFGVAIPHPEYVVWARA